jgi:hypothetical protein
MTRNAPTATRLAAALLLALLGGCAGAPTVPLAVTEEAGETAATRVYRVEELEFEAPAGWTAEATPTAFTLRGAAAGDPACALPAGWGDPTALASDGRVDRAGCPLLVLAPSADLTVAECPGDETFDRRNRWLAGSSAVAQRRDTVDARQARRFDWKATTAPAGRAVIWCVCGPSRPWYLTFWIPAEAEAAGAAALRLFQRTIRIGEGRDWR